MLASSVMTDVPSSPARRLADEDLANMYLTDKENGIKRSIDDHQ